MCAFCVTVTAQCIDFTNLEGPSVTCQYGSFENPFATTGIMEGRHSIITEQGTDPRTNNQLSFLPPEENKVVKLGNEEVGSEAESITYTFRVDPDQAILSLKFAVVFQDPNHPAIAQPRFVVRVLNETGELADPCAEYDVTAAANIADFRKATYNNTTVRWRPWTNVGINLSDYIGQQIKVQFITYDCNYHGHFGYAYFTATCIPNRLSVQECKDDSIILAAPTGFVSYSWDNHSHNSMSEYAVTDSGFTATCNIVSATGCEFTLNAFISKKNLPMEDSTFTDTICEGDAYTDHLFNIPPQYQLGTFPHQNNFYDVGNCKDSITNTLYLTVRQKYFHIYDMVCEGVDYERYGFHFQHLPAGNRVDTLIIDGSVTSSGCDSVVILHLTVNPDNQITHHISGDTRPCTNETAIYQVSQAESINSFHWVVSDGVVVVRGADSTTAELYFQEGCMVPARVTIDDNGCSHSDTLRIYPQASYNLFFQDTICTGASYSGYDFTTPRQDTAGYYTFQTHHQTRSGCDSVRVLALWVMGTPSLFVLADTTIICEEGQSVGLHAMGENSGFIAKDCDIPPVAIGDILCTDSSIVKPDDFHTSGKTALGIIFYVDRSGQHGWAVNLTEKSNLVWSSQPSDIDGIPERHTLREAISDFDGYRNTQYIRAAGTGADYPAAWNVDFDNGWYLPAAGQLYALYAQIPVINHSLQTIQGSAAVLISRTYWSSSEFDEQNAFQLNNTGGFSSYTKINPLNIRSVRSF